MAVVGIPSSCCCVVVLVRVLGGETTIGATAVVERVAKAIAVALGYEASAWPDFTLHARAALAEMQRVRDEVDNG